MKFNTDIEPMYALNGIYYDLFEGGYINPYELLEDEEEAHAVNDAMNVIDTFLKEAIALRLILEC